MAVENNGVRRRAYPHKSKIYSEFSHLYDRIFEGVFFPRIEKVVGSLGIAPGADVLELGVGTGLSLPAYPTHCHVVGIDLAHEMLEQAEDKMRDHDWRHITLREMDALQLGFPDDSFDYVTAFHVVSVVPDAGRLMHEAQRVCRPGGRLIIINHFRSARPVIGSLVDCADPITRKLGWRTTLRVDDVLDGLPLVVEQRYKTSERSLFTVLVVRNEKRLAAVG